MLASRQILQPMHKRLQQQPPSCSNPHTPNGFTLLEIVIGMVVLSIALMTMTSVLAPQTKQGIDPIWQVRAVALASSLSNEILAKPFDNNSNPAGNLTRCNEITACTLSASLGPDGLETRLDFNDVDDFNGFFQQGGNITSSAGFTSMVSGSDIYAGFGAQVEVFYDDNLDGVNDDDADGNGILDTGTLTGNTKLILITVTTPGNERIQIASVKGNF